MPISYKKPKSNPLYCSPKEAAKLRMKEKHRTWTRGGWVYDKNWNDNSN